MARKPRTEEQRKRRREQTRASMHKLRADPLYREKERKYNSAYHLERGANDPEYRERLRKYSRTYSKERYKNDPERRNYLKDYFHKYNKDPKVRKSKTQSERRRKFNISSSDFDKILALQGGVCAMCGREDPGTKRGAWHVDHDHAVAFSKGERWRGVRGILCNFCNLWLGGMGDNLHSVRARSPLALTFITHYLTVTAVETQQRLCDAKGIAYILEDYRRCADPTDLISPRQAREILGVSRNWLLQHGASCGRTLVTTGDSGRPYYHYRSADVHRVAAILRRASGDPKGTPADVVEDLGISS